MNKTLALTRMLLKNGTGQLSKRGKPIKQFLVPALLLVALLPLTIAIGNLVSMFYDALESIGQGGVVLGLGLALASLVVFMFGIFYVITVFYFAQDVEHLLPLPLKPGQIVTAKFLTVLLYEYLTLLVLLVPLLIVFGVKINGGVLYYLYAVLVYLALPVVPLVLASVIAMAIMSFAGVARNKDRFRMYGGIAAVLASFGLNMFIQRSLNKAMKPEQLQEMLLGGNNTFVDFATRSFPSVKLAANALLRESQLAGAAWLVLFVGLTALFYLVFVLLAQRFYFKGVMGISETGARRIRLNGSQLDKQTLQQSALKALVTKELRILMRTPPFFLNCVLMSFLWPVLMLIPIMTQPDFKDMIGTVRTLFDSATSSAIVPAIGLAILLFVSGANATSSTAISREGAGFFVSKYIPVPYVSIIAAKVVSGWLITMIGAVLILAVPLFLLQLPVSFILIMLAIAVAATLFTCLTGIMIDLWLPKLVWDNEQKAVKQNMNGLFNMLVSIAFAAALFFLVNWIGLGLWAAAFALLVAVIVADLLLVRLLRAKGETWFGKIEA
jgi:ABC-2 type transport system permease protein